ncbi:MAG: sulfotransferase [Roseobacter sp.]
MTTSGALQKAYQAADPRFASVECVFFVIGAQKAGTTWLSHYLKRHPDVSVPEWKEHDFWNMVEGRLEPSRMLQAQKERREKNNALRSLGKLMWFTLYARRQRSIDLALLATKAPYAPYSAYADVILENAEPNTVAAGEICPEYAILKSETLAKMARLSSNVRFLFLMRDPVSRFVSGVRHSLRKSLGKSHATTDELSQRINSQLANPNGRHLNLSRYDKTILALEESVASDRIHYVFFEEMFDQTQVGKICDFLGVPFLEGKITARANGAGKKGVRVNPEDLVSISEALKPVYDFTAKRFGTRVPTKWSESAALC